MQNLNRRTVTGAATALGLVLTIVGLVASATKGQSEAREPKDDKLQSELLLDLTLEAQTPHNLGSASGGRLVVPVSGGTFTGPRLKGTVIPPGGDWIIQRADGSRVLDVRILFRPMTEKRFTSRGAESRTRRRMEHSTHGSCQCSKRQRRNTRG